MAGEHRAKRLERERLLRKPDPPVVSMNLEAMTVVAEHLGLIAPREVFCGYIRQPLDYCYSRKGVTIGGYCALKENRCCYEAKRGEVFRLNGCPAYNAFEQLCFRQI